MSGRFVPVVTCVAFAAVLSPWAASAAKTVCGGLVQEFTYDAPDRAPIHFGGWSRAEGAQGHDYCVFADIYYADGSALWAQKADFTRGTHDWEYSAYAMVPQKPVAKISRHSRIT